VGNGRGDIKSWSLDKQKEGLKDSLKIGEILAIAFMKNYKKIVCGSSEGKIAVIDLKKRSTEVIYKQHSDAINALIVTVDDKYFITGSSDRLIKTWQQSRNREFQTLYKASGPVKSISLDPTGNKLLIGYDNQKLKLWNLAKNREEFVFLLSLTTFIQYACIQAKHFCYVGFKIMQLLYIMFRKINFYAIKGTSRNCGVY
jgi:WD40 repeat protein